MKKAEIKKILDEIRGRNELMVETRIAYYANKQKSYDKMVGDSKEYEIAILDEKIRLAIIGDIFDEIDLKLEIKRQSNEEPILPKDFRDLFQALCS